MKHRAFQLHRFVASIPPELMARYFDGLAAEPPDGWAAINGDAFDAWLRDPEQAEIEPLVRQQFRKMNDLAERNMMLLLAAFRRHEMTPDSNVGPEAHAMRLFLDCPPGFDYAWGRYLLSANAETLTDYYFPVKHLNFDEAALGQIKRGLVEFFDRTAKGKQCRIQAFRDHEQVFITIQRGHNVRTVSMFDGESDEVTYRSFRPMIDDVVIFDERTKILSAKATTRDEREAYVWQIASLLPNREEMFRTAVDSRIYTLAPLQDGTFNYQGSGEVDAVRLIRAKFHLSARASVEYKAEDVRALLQWEGFPQGALTSASLAFGFRKGRNVKWVRADITPPARGKLSDEYAAEVDAYLRQQRVKLR